MDGSGEVFCPPWTPSTDWEILLTEKSYITLNWLLTTDWEELYKLINCPELLSSVYCLLSTDCCPELLSTVYCVLFTVHCGYYLSTPNPYCGSFCQEGAASLEVPNQRSNYNFQMLITPERKVPQWSDAYQNDHKSKGFLHFLVLGLKKWLSAPISGQKSSILRNFLVLGLKKWLSALISAQKSSKYEIPYLEIFWFGTRKND